MGKQNLGGVYANMDFAPYVYQEYPKYIPTGPHGQHVIAKDADHEEKILAKVQQDQDDAPPEPVQYVSDPEKEILISRARELNVPFNSKWSKLKLQHIVNEAELEVDSLPAEYPLDKNENENSREYKEKLISDAKALDIPATHLWGIPRLKAHIAEAQARLKE